MRGGKAVMARCGRGGEGIRGESDEVRVPRPPLFRERATPSKPPGKTVQRTTK